MKRWVNIIIDICYEIIDRIVIAFFFPLKVKKGKIVCINFNGKGYGCNPKYISEQLLSRNLDIELIWLVSNMNEVLPPKIKKVKYRSIAALFELSTANIIITNTKNNLRIHKKKTQYVIQTWHASYSPKFLESALKGNNKYKTESKKNSLQTDLFLSNSKLQTEEYKKFFWCKCEIMECGYPRNDILLEDNQEKKKRIKDDLQIDKKSKVLLYAPTFRDDLSTTAYFSNLESIRNELNRTNGEWTILVRLHPNVTKYSKIYNYNRYIIDVSRYPDIQELLIVTDLLITDYSSTMFDFSIMKKPVVLYVADLEEYGGTRGLKTSFYNLPFKMYTMEEKLINGITQDVNCFDEEKVKDFMQMYGSFDVGNASVQVADRIVKILFEG